MRLSSLVRVVEFEECRLKCVISPGSGAVTDNELLLVGEECIDRRPSFRGDGAQQLLGLNFKHFDVLIDGDELLVIGRET